MSGVRLQCKAVRPSSLTLHPLIFQQRLLHPCACERLKTSKDADCLSSQLDKQADIELVWPRSRDRSLLAARSKHVTCKHGHTDDLHHARRKVDE